MTEWVNPPADTSSEVELLDAPALSLTHPAAAETDIHAVEPGPSLPIKGAEEEKEQPGPKKKKAKEPTITDLLVKTALGEAELWHTAEGEPWATVRANNWQVRSSQFQTWLRGETYLAYGKVAPAGSMNSAIGVIEARAIHDGPEDRVHLRVGAVGSALYVDLADGTGRAVRISDDGWDLVPAPIKFWRSHGMQPLPAPVRSDDTPLSELRELLRLNEIDFRLFLTVVTAALRPTGPYPIVVINGEQGSGKSQLVRMYRALVDPNSVPFTGPTSNDNDLAARAKNNHVVIFDNVSEIKGHMADTLSRLATGGGLGGRKLYTDNDEAVFLAQRPIVLNGIPDLTWRGDLADRAIIFVLSSIGGRARLPEEVLRQRFDAVRPMIFGYLLDAMADGMKRHPKILAKGGPFPRMADFAAWGMAVAPSLGWSEQDFLSAYERNRHGSQMAVLDADILAEPIIKLVEEKGCWEGTATELLNVLSGGYPEAASLPGWPHTPAQLGASLKRLTPALAIRGLTVTPGRSASTRTIRLTRVPNPA